MENLPHGGFPDLTKSGVLLDLFQRDIHRSAHCLEGEVTAFMKATGPVVAQSAPLNTSSMRQT